MEYVFRCFTVKQMQDEARQYIEENQDKIQKVRNGDIPIIVTYKDGNRFLFMTTEYYDKIYRLGRRKGIDYMTI